MSVFFQLFKDMFWLYLRLSYPVPIAQIFCEERTLTRQAKFRVDFVVFQQHRIFLKEKNVCTGKRA